MANLKKDMIALLAAIGINAKTDEEARKLLTKLLKKNDVEVSETDTIQELYEMAEVFYEPNDTSGSEEEEEEEEDAPVVKKKPTAKKVVEVEEEEEEETPAPKSKKKVTAAPAKKAAKKAAVVRGVRFDPLNNEEHDALLNPLRKHFKDAKKYEVVPLYNGVSVFILAKSSRIIIFSLKNGTVVNGDVFGVLWNNRFKNADAFHEIVAEDHLGPDVFIGKHDGDPLVTIRRISVKQWVKLLGETDLLEANLTEVASLDKKMGKNREKLEESLKKGKEAEKKTAKKAVKVVEVEEEEEEEEEEEVVVKPKAVPGKKKVVKKAVAKKK